MSSALTSAPPRGAGRMVDVFHDLDVVGNVNDNGSFAPFGLGRGAASQPRFGQVLQSSATAPATVQVSVYKGRVGTRLTSAGAAQNSYVAASGYKAMPQIERPVTDLAVVPQARVWSISACIAFGPPSAAAWNGQAWGQVGVGIARPEGLPVVGNGIALGFGFSLDNPTGLVKWYTRRSENAPLEVQAVTWPVPTTEWCPVEFRIYSATPTADAYMRAIVAGKVLIERKWLVGGILGAGGSFGLPLYAGTATTLGLGMVFHNQSDGGHPAIWVAGYRFIAAEAEDAL